MSQQNMEIIKAVYEAFARGDIPTVLGALDANVDWREAENFMYADRNPYIGPQAVLEGVFARLGGEWDGFQATPDGLLDAGEAVVAQGHYSGVYKATGKSVRAQFAHVFTFSDGKVVKFQQYTDTRQFADAAAG
jgi:uncharacterized protein